MPTIALLIWPVIAIILFFRVDRPQALIWGLLLPYLFLPEAFSIRLPGIPDLDKRSIISFSLIAGVLLTQSRHRLANRTERFAPSSSYKALRFWQIACFVTLLAAAILSILGNPETLRYGERVIPGLSVWDGVSVISALIVVITPLLLAQRYLSSPDNQVLLFKGIVIAGLIYSAFMLIEMRFSPQLHRWVYGYHQHSFQQHVRNGFRPKVFLPHGLHVGFFIFTAAVAAFVLWKDGHGKKWAMAALWLGCILLGSRNLGASMILILTLSVMFFMPLRLRLIYISVIAALVLAYPMARQANVAPTDQIIAVASTISIDRADSFAFRLANEDLLIAKANQKPWTGWGIWGRNRVFDSAGNDIAITDGLWIQLFGVGGWPQYLGFFGLITIPLFFLPRMLKRKNMTYVSLGCGLIMAGNLTYLIPNNVMSPISWVITGVIFGMIGREATSTTTTETVPASSPHYSRFGPQSTAQLKYRSRQDQPLE